MKKGRKNLIHFIFLKLYITVHDNWKGQAKRPSAVEKGCFG